MQPEQINNKQRRYIRYAIDLPATLAINAATELPCVISDFCTHGLFLKLNDQGSDTTLPDSVKICFRIHAEQGATRFELLAQVMHSSSNGVGVVIDNMPLETFNALKTLTNQERETDKTLDTEKRSHFRKFFKNALLEHLQLLVNHFFTRLDEDLERVSEQKILFSNRSALDDLITTLRLKQDSLSSEFCHSVIDQIDCITENQSKKEDISSFDRSLSLVEKEDFEDWLHNSAIIRKLANHFEDDINQVTRELSRIFGRSKSTINNPVSPAVLCDSFRELIIPFRFDNDLNSALYNCFGKSLYLTLSSFYQNVSAILSSQAASKRTFEHTSEHTPDRFPTTQEQHFSHQQPLLSGGEGLDLFNQYVQPSSQQTLTEMTGRLLDLLNEIDTNTLTSGHQVASTAAKTDARQEAEYYDQRDILSAIAQLQKQPQDQAIHQDHAQLQHRLEETLQRLGQQNKRVSQQNNQQLNVYGRFFESLLKESLISDALKPYIESMHLPLMALPLQGDDFLRAEEGHPVKNILNQLAVLDQALRGKSVTRKSKIKGFLDKMTDRIQQDSVSNPLVFAEIEKELTAFTQQISRSLDARIDHVIEVHEGQQKLAKARQTVQEDIDQIMAGRPVPTVIPMLLDAGWQHLLVFAELNKDKGKDAKLRYMKVLEDLLFWLFEQDAVVKIQASSIQTTITFIDDRLGSISTSTPERKQVIDELTALLLGTGTPKVRKPVRTVQTAKADTEDTVSFPSVSDYWLALVENLCVGDWLAIRRESESPEPMKLVWIGETPPLYVLVNPDGIRNVDYSKADLAELFRSGAAEQTEDLDLPLTERTTNSVLQNVHENFVFNATHDPDTQLFTRDEFIKQLKNEIPNLADSQHILCQLDILEFRMISTMCGLEGSAQLLKSTAELISKQLQETDLCARLSDNTFAILFKQCGNEQAQLKAKQLAKDISASHFNWEDKRFPIAVSMGLTAFSEQSFDIYQLLQQANAASLSAERSGQNHVVLFTDDDENIQRQHKLLEWIGHIDNVIAEGRLFARCQQISALVSGETHTHYEILLGIKDNDGNIIPPDFFIPAVERSKRMPEIDQWVINTVFAWIDANRASFDNMDGFSINLSGQSINSEEFLLFLNERLASCQFPVEKLVFEVTETVASENVNFTKEFIRSIKEFGCKFSLDDFGSGYSSYAYLKNLNVDYLKIDGAFVKDIANNKADYAIVKSMNEIAHSLGLKTIAEYVENAEIKVIIKEIGVDYGQGYFIHKPMPLAELIIDPPEKELFLFEDNSFWDI